MKRNFLVRKFLNDIMIPMEEDIIDSIVQKLRTALQRKPNWNRNEINDVIIDVIQEVKNERREDIDT